MTKKTTPQHYRFEIEGKEFDCNDITKQAFIGNKLEEFTPLQWGKVIEAFQYIIRADRKNGIEDLLKAVLTLLEVFNQEELEMIQSKVDKMLGNKQLTSCDAETEEKLKNNPWHIAKSKEESPIVCEIQEKIDLLNTSTSIEKIASTLNIVKNKIIKSNSN